VFIIGSMKKRYARLAPTLLDQLPTEVLWNVLYQSEPHLNRPVLYAAGQAATRVMSSGDFWRWVHLRNFGPDRGTYDTWWKAVRIKECKRNKYAQKTTSSSWLAEAIQTGNVVLLEQEIKRNPKLTTDYQAWYCLKETIDLRYTQSCRMLIRAQSAAKGANRPVLFKRAFEHALLTVKSPPVLSVIMEESPPEVRTTLLALGLLRLNEMPAVPYRLWEVLLVAGADPNTNWQGDTVLECAAKRGNARLCDLLVRCGALVTSAAVANAEQFPNLHRILAKRLAWQIDQQRPSTEE
jgi:hypothetical protein